MLYCVYELFGIIRFSLPLQGDEQIYDTWEYSVIRIMNSLFNIYVYIPYPIVLFLGSHKL